MLHPDPADHHGRGPCLDNDFDLILLQLAGRQTPRQFFAADVERFLILASLPCFLPDHVDQSVLNRRAGLVLDLRLFALANQADGAIDQFAHDALDVAAVVTDLGVLGRLHFDERRTGQFREPPGDFCLSNARGPNHQDVFR